MDDLRPGCLSHPGMIGLVVGWLIGILWWAGLSIAFEPAVITTSAGEQLVEQETSVASHVVYAPLAGVPWAVVGLFVGAVSSLCRGYCIPLAAILGTVAGGAYTLATRRFDGWLALTMPLNCFVGTLAGVVVGCVYGLARGLFRHPLDHI